MAIGQFLTRSVRVGIAGAGLAMLAVLLFGVTGMVTTAWAAQQAASAETVVRLQLKWTHQFQFAGIYAALAQGYYRDAGIDLQILEGGPAIDPVGVVTGGAAEFGIGNSSLIIDRTAGAPIMVVAPIFQHSPFVILARTEAGLNVPRDLAGRRLALEAHSAEVEAYLKTSGVPLASIDVVPHTGDAVGLFASGVDAISAYTTTEPFDLLVAGVPFQMWSPREIGIDFYGDTLFVDARFAAAHPETVRAVREATLRGWDYALRHTGEIIELIQSQYAPGMSRQKLEFEANDIRRLMLSDIVDIGYGSGARWRHIADVFAETGMMPRDASLAGFVFEERAPAEPVWPYIALTAAVTLLAAVALVAHRFYRISHELRAQIEARRRLEEELTQLARTDELTRLPNRRHFLSVAAAQLEHCRAEGAGLAVLVFDIDHFKAINDTYGHAVGDRVLVAVAAASRDAAPPDVVLARIGGEEFAAALPTAGPATPMEVAERLRDAVKGVAIPVGEGDEVAGVTASFGLAEGGEASLDTLLSRADHAMYVAKRSGGDRIEAPPVGESAAR
ncbi:ABC transporter substrate-binding protein [Pseudoxanthobacter sp. M-2]|uniref:ABC transporter substrate-binding protein n=1 Tax=Pseudoxanthobacter sp. M-2 TaxID=3078754 RepID=UPI0038FC9A46